MLEVVDAITETFDIRRLDKECNFPKCPKKPTKCVVIYEFNIKKGKHVFAEIFVCDEHVEIVKKIVKKIREIVPNATIQCEVREI